MNNNILGLMNYLEKELEMGFASDEGQQWIEDLYNKPNSWESSSSKLARTFDRICIFKVGLNSIWQEDLLLLDGITSSPEDKSYYDQIISRAPAIRWLEEFIGMVEPDIARRIHYSGDNRLIYEANSKTETVKMALGGEETNITVSEEDFKQIDAILTDVQASNYTRRYLGFLS